MDDVDARPGDEPADDPTALSRRRLMAGLAGMGATGVAASVASASPAAAADGDDLKLGQPNAATSPTVLSTTVEGETTEVTLGAGDWAVFARADSTAIIGVVPSGGVAGVNGEAIDTVGVLGNATESPGIGVAALSHAGPALAAQSTTDGVTLLLVPADRQGPPTSTPEGLSLYSAGCFSVDERGDIWLCIDEGDPGTWTRLLRDDTASGRTVPIPPLRAIDTRAPGGRPAGTPAIPGQKAGPLKGGTSLTLDLAGITPIPPTATGVIGNLTAVTPTYSGYLAARPSGTTATTSSLNFPHSVAAMANAFTSQLGPAGLTITASGTASGTYHLLVDITAYIS